MAAQDELQEREASLQTGMQALEHENNLKTQQIESLEKYLNETKDSLNKV